VAKVNLYITLDGSRPGDTNYAFCSEGANGPQVVLITPDAPAYARNGTLRVAVACPFIPDGGAVGFDVAWAVGDDELQPLASGLPLAA
jgi:hypothetical protein